jgi:hypothetical protein
MIQLRGLQGYDEFERALKVIAGEAEEPAEQQNDQ